MLRIFLNVIKSFSPKEFSLFLAGSTLVLLSGVLLIIQVINTHTIAHPADGGTFTEGVVGQVSYLNPVLAREGSADKDAITLLFASVYDLAETIQHDDNFRTWNIRLKEGVTWHDTTPIKSDDIIFTLQLIQNADTASPLAANWQNVSVERVSEREMRFETVNSYALFENLLRELRPLPKKYFADLSPANIRLSAFNLKPVGSGPFEFEELEKRQDGFITSIFLKRNEAYAAIGSQPHLERFGTLYFENEDLLLRSFNKGLIDGFGTFSPQVLEQIELNAQETYVPTSRYYALFFNPNAHAALTSQNVRQALSLFINKDMLIQDVFQGRGVVQQGPLPIYGRAQPRVSAPPTGNADESRALLEGDGWFFDDQTRTWNKVSDASVSQLTFTIKIPDSTLVHELAEAIKTQWESVGIKTNVQTVDAGLFPDDVLETRNYEMIVYGNILQDTPDLTSFWHSNERFYPGLNFSLFESAAADTLLSELRSIDPTSEERNEALMLLADEIVSKTPAAFLVSPSYMYLTRSKSIGAPMEHISTPDSRFEKITEWYAKTKRVSR